MIRHSSIDSITPEGEPRFDLSVLMAIPAWYSEALCAQVDQDGFFPEKGGSTREAKKVCGQCPVVEKCLQYALDNDERHGVWGGKSEHERRKLVRETRSAA